MEANAMAWNELRVILCGIVMGTLSRAATLKSDSRQYPSYPNGVFINLITGFVASCLGAVAIPALLSGNFVAVTFLAMAVQHFRDIRKMERDSLDSLENTGFVPRGEAYIDGIAKTYEARNYISLLTAFLVVLAARALHLDALWPSVVVSAAVGGAVTAILVRFTKGHAVGGICRVTRGKMEVRGSELYVDGIYVANTLGTERSRSFFLKEGVAVVLTPNTSVDRLALENRGQRQAILFEVAQAFGVRRFHFTRRDFATGRVVIAFVPIVRDEQGIERTICKTPVLESSRKGRRRKREGAQ